MLSIFDTAKKLLTFDPKMKIYERQSLFFVDFSEIYNEVFFVNHGFPVPVNQNINFHITNFISMLKFISEKISVIPYVHTPYKVYSWYICGTKNNASKENLVSTIVGMHFSQIIFDNSVNASNN